MNYSFNLKKDEIGERFVVKVTVTDVGGRSVSRDVLVTMDGDFSAPAFTASPDKEVTVLIKQQTSFKLSFTATDDRQLDYVLINIPGVEGYADKKVDAGGQSSLTHTERFTLPNCRQELQHHPEAVDKKRQRDRRHECAQCLGDAGLPEDVSSPTSPRWKS